MSKASEEKTKGFVADKLKNIPSYPSSQNTEVDGVTWFKEDSYKGTSYDWLSGVFATASKKQTRKSKGTPDFMVVKNESNVIVVIECKGSSANHSSFDNIEEFAIHGFGTPEETEGYAVNGALWYASFLSDNYDVIAIGVSGQMYATAKVTSFVWPKGGSVADIEIIEDGVLATQLVSIHDYEKDADIVLGRLATTEAEIRKELRRYTLQCANFLRSNGIEDNSKAGFVSAIILGLTNHESKLYSDTKTAIERKRAAKSRKLLNDPLAKNSIKMLKAALYGDGNEYDPDYVRGIWDIDEIPKGKRTSLKRFYDGLLSKTELSEFPKGKDVKYFIDGDTVLSCCIYSLYENVIEVLEKYSGIDVMGEFYTTFLRFTKGNAKEKGIVLTPKHITDLFCDIAEYYSDKKFDETTKIVDICCGSGAFLISALDRIKRNIYSETISESEKSSRYGTAQRNSLIGVERDSSMYALAYANMRFHGDGKSNLFNCSSLLMDSYAPVDDSGKTYLNEQKIPLHVALRSFGGIDIGMINPPYSLDKKDNAVVREYADVQKIRELEDKNSKLAKILKDLNKKDPILYKSEITTAEKEIAKNNKQIGELNEYLAKNGLEEVVIQKGQDELDFIASILHYLKEGGIGIAIVPMSCAGSSGSQLRSELLKHHTLLACMTMPNQLFFDSHVGAATCIMVFKAHIPHNFAKGVFFGIWKDDGFSVIPHNGRKDSGAWNDIRQKWIGQLDGTDAIDETIWIKQKINEQGEALPEAYVKTNYEMLSDEDFKNCVRKYALYKYMDKMSALDLKDSQKFLWLLDNYTVFEQEYKPILENNSIKLTDRKWDWFVFGDIISGIRNGKSYNNSDLIVSDSEDYVFYITRTEQNNGVSMCAQKQDYVGLEKANAITIGDTTATIFFQEHEFITGPHMIVVRADWLNVYTANFIITILNQEKYRYPVFGRAFTKDLIKQTKVYLPIDKDGNPDYQFMEDYIKSLPFSKKI